MGYVILVAFQKLQQATIRFVYVDLFFRPHGITWLPHEGVS